MTYPSDKWTDEALEELERRIATVYNEAAKDLDKEVKAYFAKFKLRDEEMQKLVDAGEMSKADYQQWRMTQMGRGQRFEALRDKVAERYTEANIVANAYVNDATPSIYSLNRNYEAYTIEKTVGNCDFTMWDESTVRRLLVEDPDLMPYYPPSRALSRGIDLAYGKSQITKHVTSGIIRGLAPGKIANELMANIYENNRTGAVRAARTAVTTAQNAGRFDSYVAAEKMGIKIKRRWICTKDARTRPGHTAVKDVEGTKEPFIVDGEEMMFPGDASRGAHGWNIYNCRCTTRTVEKDGIEAEPRQMRVTNPEWENATPEERKNIPKTVVVNEMNYSEWQNWKNSLANPVESDTITSKFGFGRITGKHSIEDDIKAANPNYKKGREWQVNCQRCVPTYEMRRRGYNVEAMPRIMSGTDETARNWANIFEGAKWDKTVASNRGTATKRKIVDKMVEHGDGARGEIYVVWKGASSAHVFAVENVGGAVRFIDPQTGDGNCEHYFEHIMPSKTWLLRTDNLEPSDYIKGCCKNKE